MSVRRDALMRTLTLEIAGLEAVRDALDTNLGNCLLEAVDLILTRGAQGGRVLVTGVGKSGHIGRKVAATLTSTGTPAHFLHAGDAGHGDLGLLQATDTVLAISWSGETPDLAPILDYTRRFHIPLVALTSSRASSLGSIAEVCLQLPSMPEACPQRPRPYHLHHHAVGCGRRSCHLPAGSARLLPDRLSRPAPRGAVWAQNSAAPPP